MENNETTLKANSISKLDVIIMAICAAGPVMCLSGSLGDIMSGSGTAAALAFILATVVLILVGSSFGQLSARYNSAGGTYAYVRSVFGERTGFVAAWLNMGVTICTGVIGAVFSTYLHELVPAIPMWVGILILLIPIFFIGWRGVEMSTKVLIVVWVVQMALILYPAFHIWSMNPDDISNILGNSSQAFTPGNGMSGLMLAVLVCVWCYVGFEGPAYMGEELKGGNKAVKFAIPVSAIGIGVVYAISCWAWTGSMDMSNPQVAEIVNSGSGTLMVDYCNLVGYTLGGKLVSIAALVSCIGCFIAFATTSPRGLFDMGRNGYLPASTAKVNKYQTPSVSLVVYCIAWLAAALYGAYGNMSHLFTFMAIFASATYIMICAANIKDRWNEKGFKSFLQDKLLPLIAIAILVYMIVSSDASSLLATGIWLVGCIVAAFIWYAARKSKKSV